jgi:hypothetical protein
MTYQIINDLESIGGCTRNRIAPDNRQYVKTVEFIIVISVTVGRNILNEICEKSSQSDESDNSPAKRMINDLRAIQNGGADRNPEAALASRTIRWAWRTPSSRS